MRWTAMRRACGLACAQRHFEVTAGRADEGDEGDEADEPDEGALTPRDEAAEEKEAEAAREHARSRALSPLSQALGFRIPGLDDARHTGDI